MRKIEKHMKKISISKKTSRLEKFAILCYFFILFLMLVILPPVIYFGSNWLMSEVLSIKFEDYNMTNIFVTILFSLMAIDIAISTLSKSKKEIYYLGKKLDRSFYFTKVKSFYIFWQLLYWVGFVVCAMSSDFHKLSNYSIVLSFLFAFKIIFETLSINKSDAEIYYLSNIKMHCNLQLLNTTHQ